MTGEGAPNMPAGGPVRLPGQGQWSGTALLRSGPANGTTTVGVYKPSAATLYLRNSNTTGKADVTVSYGTPAGSRSRVTGTATAPRLSVPTTPRPPPSTSATATPRAKRTSPSPTETPAGSPSWVTGTASNDLTYGLAAHGPSVTIGASRRLAWTAADGYRRSLIPNHAAGAVDHRTRRRPPRGCPHTHGWVRRQGAACYSKRTPAVRSRSI